MYPINQRISSQIGTNPSALSSSSSPSPGASHSPVLHAVSQPPFTISTNNLVPTTVLAPNADGAPLHFGFPPFGRNLVGGSSDSSYDIMNNARILRSTSFPPDVALANLNMNMPSVGGAPPPQLFNINGITPMMYNLAPSNPMLPSMPLSNYNYWMPNATANNNNNNNYISPSSTSTTTTTSSSSSSVEHPSLQSLEDILTQEQQTCIEIRDVCGWMMKSARAALPDGCPADFISGLREHARQLTHLIDTIDNVLERKARCGTDQEKQQWYSKRMSQVSRPRRFRNPKKTPSVDNSTTNRKNYFDSTTISDSDQVMSGESSPRVKPISSPNNSGTALPTKSCAICGVTQSPEWRKGPTGSATLCNACGLHYAKTLRNNNSTTPSSSSTATAAAANSGANIGTNNLPSSVTSSPASSFISLQFPVTTSSPSSSSQNLASHQVPIASSASNSSTMLSSAFSQMMMSPSPSFTNTSPISSPQKKRKNVSSVKDLLN